MKTTSLTPYANCLIFTYLYLALNSSVCCISFAAKAEGHYWQLLVTLRTASIWGMCDGFLRILALVCGAEFYQNVMKNVLMILGWIFNSGTEVTILFLLLSFISYLNVAYLFSLLYGIANVLLSYLVNKYMEEVFGKLSQVKYAILQRNTPSYP